MYIYQYLTLVIQFYSFPQENDGVFTLLAIFCVLSWDKLIQIHRF